MASQLQPQSVEFKIHSLNGGHDTSENTAPKPSTVLTLCTPTRVSIHPIASGLQPARIRCIGQEGLVGRSRRAVFEVIVMWLPQARMSLVTRGRANQRLPFCLGSQ